MVSGTRLHVMTSRIVKDAPYHAVPKPFLPLVSFTSLVVSDGSRDARATFRQLNKQAASRERSP